MKYFLDTEFIENGKTIDLISIGIVCEDGREFYAVNRDCDFSQADDWVLQNVLYPIGLDRSGFSSINPTNPDCSPTAKETILYSASKRNIANNLLVFLTPTERSSEEDWGGLEFWGAWSAYDWVVFCQLFGRMIDLPKGFPFYCGDVIQLADYLQVGRDDFPPSPINEHNALADARWTRDVYNCLKQKG